MKTRYFILLTMGMNFLSCTKGLLEEKPDNALVVPTTLSDFNSILNNVRVFNKTPGLQTIAADDFFITDAGFNALSNVAERNSYIWADDVYETTSVVQDWNTPYQQVFYANVILDGLTLLEQQSETAEYKHVKGSALFHRAFAFYNLAQLFALPYKGGVNAQEPGIPIRLGADVNIKSARGTLEETYNQIINDLLLAATLLPEQASLATMPTKGAAFAMLARVSLSMEAYGEALEYADNALGYHNGLTNYNSLDPNAPQPFPQVREGTSDEVVFYSEAILYSFSRSAQVSVDSSLYNAYKEGDLRKVLFFRDMGDGIRNFKGNYTGNIISFGGLASDELYLIRAECLIRQGNVTEGLATLNHFLATRYLIGTFEPETAQSTADALDRVLVERRKQLINRGVRWSDLRRLNHSPQTEKTLIRVLGGIEYELVPNSNRYVFPIPNPEVELSSLEQNPR